MRVPVKVIRSEEEPQAADLKSPDPGTAWGRNIEFPEEREEEREKMSRKRKNENQSPERDHSKKDTAEKVMADVASEMFSEEAEEKRGAEAARPALSRDEISAEESMDWGKRYLRLLADFENYKRHANAERERLTAVGKELALSDLFPLVEHLERAIKTAGEAQGDSSPQPNPAAAILEGLNLVYREFLAVLSKHGIERIPSRGRPFDPNLHEAVAAIPSPGVEENIILEEVRPGFRRNGKTIRPAAVIVAKPPQEFDSHGG